MVKDVFSFGDHYSPIAVHPACFVAGGPEDALDVCARDARGAGS
jgi:hypothetical protein